MYGCVGERVCVCPHTDHARTAAALASAFALPASAAAAALRAQPSWRINSVCAASAAASTSLASCAAAITAAFASSTTFASSAALAATVSTFLATTTATFASMTSAAFASSAACPGRVAAIFAVVGGVVAIFAAGVSAARCRTPAPPAVVSGFWNVRRGEADLALGEEHGRSGSDRAGEHRGLSGKSA